jgi:hypothetical protein
VVAVPVQFKAEYSVAVIAAVTPEVTLTLTFPSVNDVVAAPEVDPVATTEYVATNHVGRLKPSTKCPFESAERTTERFQLLPQSSFTMIWIDSPGCQPDPFRTTRSPGA